MFQIKRYKKHIMYFLVVLVLFTISGFFIAPPLIKSILVKKLSAALSRPVTVGKIYFNPYTLGVRILNVRIGERSSNGTFFSLTELKARLGLSSIGGTVALHDLSLTEPYVSIIRNDDGSYNFSDLIAVKEKSPAGQKTKKSPGSIFSLRDISIRNGSADFWDAPVKKKHTVRELNLTIPLLSNQKKNIDEDVQPALSMRINNAPYLIRGRTKPFADSLETNFTIGFENVDIPVYLAYLPVKMLLSVPSGFLDATMQLSFRQYEKKTTSLSLSGDIRITQLVVNDDKMKPVVNLPGLTVKVNSIEPFAGRIDLAKIGIESPEITLSRDKNAALNIATLIPVNTETKNKKPAGKEKATPPHESGNQPPLNLTIDTIELTGGKVLFTDLSPKQPAKIVLEDMELKAEKISLAKGSTGTFQAKFLINKKGAVVAGGTLGIDPLAIIGKIDIKGVDIRPFEPYFAEKFRVSVTGGSFETEGSLNIKGEKKDGPEIHYAGKAAITGLNSVDKETSDSLLRFKSLHVRDLNLGINPTAVTAKGVSLTDFYANIAITPNKTINLQNVMVKEPVKAKENPEPDGENIMVRQKPKENDVPVKIDIVTLQGGTVRFRDE
ncbi:MAG: DUF748 domain-containing protein, partial [Syntrophorhabdus sp.]